MSKRMRELQTQIQGLYEQAKGYMAEGDNKDVDKAAQLMDQADALQKELDALAKLEKAGKAGVPDDAHGKGGTEKADGFKMLAKMMHRKPLSDAEKTALVSGSAATNGEGYLIPEDVKAEIRELRKSYVSARELVTVETTDALAGSVNYEAGTPAGLLEFEDGAAIGEDDGPEFEQRKFAIGWFGKLIPVSRILLGAAKASLSAYLNRWFVRNAIITENAKIFATFKAGYNNGTPKALAGWKAFKASITKDLDPSCLIDGVIATNQSGFAALDAEEDADGRPVLQANPAHPTEKLFQGLRIKVYPDAQLPNIDATHFPMIYGATKAGATLVEHEALEFAVSEHYLFNKNQNCIRVIEGFDVMSTDKGAYIYGSFSATPQA